MREEEKGGDDMKGKEGNGECGEEAMVGVNLI